MRRVWPDTSILPATHRSTRYPSVTVRAETTGRRDRRRRRLCRSSRVERAELARATLAGLSVDPVDANYPSLAMPLNSRLTRLLPHDFDPRLHTSCIHGPKMAEPAFVGEALREYHTS
jgi:hypothetical protein